MDKQQFLRIMQELNIVYGERKFPLTKEAVSVWNDYLGKYDETGIHAAVRRHVENSPFPPTISEILDEYRSIREAREEDERGIDRIFDRLVAIFPCAEGSEAEKSVYAGLTRGSVAKAESVLEQAKEYVKYCEQHMEVMPMTLSVFLTTVQV